jgi:hypothetical protein
MSKECDPFIHFNDSTTDAWRIFQATVAYYVLLDNRFRATNGYLGADYQESTVSSHFLPPMSKK